MEIDFIPDLQAIEHKTGLYRGGFVITPLTDAGTLAIKKYKGVKMKSFFIPAALFDGFTTHAALNGACCISIQYAE